MMYFVKLQHFIRCIVTLLCDTTYKAAVTGFHINMATKLSFYYIIVFLCLFAGQNLLSQTSKDNYSGYWENPESWSPRWDAPLTNKIDQNITINGFIKTQGDLSFQEGHLNVNDTLVIDGNLEIGEGTEIKLEANAVLIVLGSVMIKDKAKHIKLDENAYFVIGGEFMVQNGAELNEFNSKDDPPKIFIEDVIQPSEITDDDKDFASLDCKEPKFPYPHAGCTYGDFVDFESDPLYSFYETLINGDPPTITFQPEDVIVCNETDIEFTVIADNAEDYQWQVDDGGGFEDLVDDFSHTGCYTNQLRIQNVTTVKNDYLYRCKISNINDISVLSAPALLTVEASVTADAGSDANICQSSTHTLIGSSVTNGNGSYLWTHNGQGTLSGATTLTPTYTPHVSDAGKTTILMLIAQGSASCSSASDQLSIRIDEQVSGSVGPDDAICGTNYLLSGSGNGGTGIWTLGNGAGEATFLPRNDMETPKVLVSEPGEYVFKWILSNGACSDESSVTIIFKEVPNVTIEAETNICGMEQPISASLNKGTGFWQIVSGAEGAFLDKNIEKNNNKIRVKEFGTYTLAWIANLNGCSDTAYQVISFNPVPIANAGQDKELFYNRETIMDATLQNKQTGHWTIEKGFGVFENENLNTTKVTHLQIGENVLGWNVSNGLCESKSLVSVEVSDAEIPNIITPNGDGMNEYFIIKDIDNLGPIHIVIFNRWSNKVYESNNYKNEWNGRDANGNELMNDTYYYYLEFANKKVIKGYVLIQR